MQSRIALFLILSSGLFATSAMAQSDNLSPAVREQESNRHACGTGSSIPNMPNGAPRPVPDQRENDRIRRQEAYSEAKNYVNDMHPDQFHDGEASAEGSSIQFDRSVVELRSAGSKMRPETPTSFIISDRSLRAVAASYVHNIRVYAHSHGFSPSATGTEWISVVRQEYFGNLPISLDPFMTKAEECRKLLLDFAGEEAVVRFEKAQRPPHPTKKEAMYLTACKKRPSGWTTEIDGWARLDSLLKEYSLAWNQYASSVVDFSVERARFRRSWARMMLRRATPVNNDVVVLRKLRAQLVDFANENSVQEYEASFVPRTYR